MTYEEKVKVLDALELSVEETRAYLDRICGKTPLELVYKKPDGSYYCSRNVEKDNLFIGMLVENVVFFSRGYTAEDIPDGKQDIFAEDICNWITQQEDYPKGAYPILELQRELLNRHCRDLSTTLAILDYHGLKMPVFHYDIHYFKSLGQSCNFYSYDGFTRLEFSLKAYGEHVWICASKSDIFE